MEIGDKKLLREYYSILYRLLGVIIDFVSEDGETLKLCEYERFNEFCKLVQASDEGKKACDECDRKIAREIRETGKSMIYECHAGLVDVSVPLFIDKRFVGSLATGQILSRPPTEASFAEVWKRCASMGIDKRKLREAYFATPVFEEDKLRALVDLVSLIGNYMVESENKLLFLEAFKEKNKISAARQFVGDNYQRKLSVSEVARLVGLSASRFSHLFKEETGTSFVNYVNRYRIERAKELLVNSKLTVTEIADAVGFQSLPHFNRIFRKLESRSPSAHRRRPDSGKR